LEYYTAVGGTLLKVDKDGNYIGEQAWSGMGATGGGRSMFTPRPLWQRLLNIPANLNGSKFDGRGVPDIAGNAHPWSGLLTPTDFGIQAIGGTSEAAPLTSVGAGKVTEATGQRTGYWNPILYKLKSNSFRDVTVGNNTDEGVQGYPSTKGYDLNTGLGSLNVGNMIDNYNAMAKTPASVKALRAFGSDMVSKTKTRIIMTPIFGTGESEVKEQESVGAYK
jgi:kumamolisin